jgi:Mg/Co/Ni transporter MgtE
VPKKNILPNMVNTVGDLANALKYARTQAGFVTVSQFVKETSFPRSTAYRVEEGLKKPEWATVAIYLGHCGITDLHPWEAAYSRVTNESTILVPTATQMAEMGAEMAAAILSEIDYSRAADLIRKIALKQAAEIIPKMDPSVAIEILGATSRTRKILLFEQIESAYGAELIAEMSEESIAELLTELHDTRASELIAKLPRRLAEKTLKMLLSPDHTVRLLAEMFSGDAIKFLPRLDFDLTAKVISAATAQTAARLLSSLDTDVATAIFAGMADEQRISRLLREMDDYAAAGVLTKMGHKQADKLIKELPAKSLSFIVPYFDNNRQTEILSNVIDLAAVLGWFREPMDVEDERHIRPLLERISIPRILDMIRALEPHEKVLLVALLRTRQESILAGLTEGESAHLCEQLSIPGIASNLAYVDAKRARYYMHELPEGPPIFLSHMSHETAMSILYECANLKTIGKYLDSVNPSLAAFVLKSSHGFEAAHIVDSMHPEHALAAFRLLEESTVHRILDTIDERSESKRSLESDIAPDDPETRRSTRQGATSKLRALYEAEAGQEARPGE